MTPGMVRQIDAVYPLYGGASRSKFVCKACNANSPQVAANGEHEGKLC